MHATLITNENLSAMNSSKLPGNSQNKDH